MSPPALAESFFRHEHARLVATLARRVGLHELELVEDAVQGALLTAVERWRVAGLPDDPSAWLFRVAQNRLMGELRKRSGRRRILERRIDPDADPSAEVVDPAAAARLAGELQDDLLRMLFVCCDGSIPVESQLVLALKTLCGFSVREIAIRLFTSEANVYKRLTRARARLGRSLPDLEAMPPDELPSRLSAVHEVLYLLFTEGYLSSHATMAIRRELCDDAIRLALVLAEHPVGRTPTTFALVALMHLHAARMSARQDRHGGLLLLQEQDREQWDARAIETGLGWLARSAEGDVLSRYHAEAAIAAEHCLAPSFDQTRWDRIASAYAQLEQVAPSPLHRLNRAVAVAEHQGPAAGLALLSGFEPPTWLAGSYMWSAVLADLHRRNGDLPGARRYREVAIASAPTDAVRALLRRRLGG